MRGLFNSAAVALGAPAVLVLATAAAAPAQTLSASRPSSDVQRVAAIASGSIRGVVRDEQGAPLSGATVSAFGATTAFAVTDRGGRFELRTLAPGSYILRAQLNGFSSSISQVVDVRPSARAVSAIALRRAAARDEPNLLAAGAGVIDTPIVRLPDPIAATADPAPDATTQSAQSTASSDADDHSEAAWRLRHGRRGILKDATDAVMVAAEDDDNPFGPSAFARAVQSPAHFASNVFAGAPISGQVNLLTTGSFDSPQQLLTADSFARSVAYFAVGAPVGNQADWEVHGGLTQGDVASWIVAGSYTTRAPARHRYDVGLSYATQRYDGGNVSTLRDVTEGSRNAGGVYGFDTFAVTPRLTLTYGGGYSRYDYLSEGGLLSPKVAVTVSPADHLRVSALVSSRAVAPGAEEFVPPDDRGLWLPPQRIFSSLDIDQSLEAERTNHVEVAVERDLAGGTTVAVRAFRQHTSDQLITVFGIAIPDRPADSVDGHYFVGNAGAVDAAGWSTAVKTSVADRVRGSVEYSLANTRWNSADLAYLVAVAPAAARSESERIHTVSTSFETDVPETATHVVVAYRISNGFSQAAGLRDRANLNTRFDVQVRQSLPFMDFSTTKWEVLVDVRNFFRDAASDQSVYDELLVVRPPKRVVGGLTLRF